MLSLSPRVLRVVFCLVLLPTLSISANAQQAASETEDQANGPAARQAAGLELFEKKIRPVLIAKCYSCHSADADEAKGGLLVDTRQGLRRGGESGPAITPGKPQSSLLMEALRFESFEMPPDGQLEDGVIADFAQWISLGAPDPRVGVAVASNEPLPRAGQDWWSLQPVGEVKVPSVRQGDWPRTDIDRFVLARLDQEGLRPAADASPEALLRRVYFDLVGMPPSPADVETFGADPSAEKFTAVVDRLLASPQFGERWGRHWLDVARYAESNGRDRDVINALAWRYRDYVIAAFQNDKPYDQFVREQIAGDLLPAENVGQRSEGRIATGFLAIGPKSFSSAGVRFEMELVDEQIDVATRAVLGLTVSCARCHDHKFDPIPTRDYYALAGIFRSTETLWGAGSGKKSTDLWPIGENADIQAGLIKAFQQRLAKLNDTKAQLDKQIKLYKGQKNQEQLAKAQAKLRAVQADIQDAQADAPARPEYAMGVREANKPVNSPVFQRGETAAGGGVPRGLLSCLPADESHVVPSVASGRLQLAAWLTEPGNPLTARVAVNRVWHHLFGRGLVRTVDNFGFNGERPSHPELLDYLATQFVAEGWSFKRIIRQVVLSRAYQVSTAFDEANYEIDPDNALLWRRSPRRLDAEALRDAMLAASGELDLRPRDGSPVEQMGAGEWGRGVKTEPIEAEYLGRSVYLPILRGWTPEPLRLFDVAEPSIVVGERAATTVPAQALYFMNNSFVLDRAAHAGKQLVAMPGDDAERVREAYLRCYSRPPDELEMRISLDYLSRAGKSAGKAPSAPGQPARPDAAWAAFCQALFASAEFRYTY